VSRLTTKKRWEARVRLGQGVRITVGYFDTKDEADQAEEEVRKKYRPGP